jgi:hypothetical protein
LKKGCLITTRKIKREIFTNNNKNLTTLNLGQHKISTEYLATTEGNQISLEKYHFVFNKWTKPHNFDTYNGKPLLELDNEPLFAELLFLRLLEKEGYKGVWVDTYRNKFWQRLPHFSFPVVIDKKIEDLYNEIYALKGGKKSGCFDVVAYKENEFIFAELKRKKKDEIQPTQIEWLKAAIKIESYNNKFLLVEWETTN